MSSCLRGFVAWHASLCFQPVLQDKPFEKLFFRQDTTYEIPTNIENPMKIRSTPIYTKNEDSQMEIGSTSEVDVVLGEHPAAGRVSKLARVPVHKDHQY